ncbi:ADP-ribosylglycohydrolase family protein [Anaerofilum sp. BX8]|uniref:ADP-ribosylglycohydrolase family protein n=1 Tax=Anaerofilum hominis TaxID=2763016 RepID=A0A923L147_9FIRM|nr:ADP-ribosylglycohydrolase family protein [Anaerofilum hominis]MBC5581377.1 ADP-ribosylglycohydrolase family protein [Anaerofilum hominis]
MKQDKVLGALLAAAIGDAMGAPLDSLPVYLIKRLCGGGEFVRDYTAPPEGALAPELKKGMVSGSFSSAFAAVEAFVRHGGISDQAVTESLLEWKNGRYKFYFDCCADPTTRYCIQKLEGSAPAEDQDKFTGFQKTLNSGAAARAWVAGLLHPGDPDRAVRDALVMGLPTHDNVIALSGACAVAAGTACAMMERSDTGRIVEAGLYGAQTGYRKALEVAGDAAGASVEKRIRLAVRIGLSCANDLERCVNEMTDLVGTGSPANEAVPAAFGFLVSAGGDVMETIYRSVNAGNASSAVATMAGAMAGALRGCAGLPPRHLEYLSDVNGMDLAGTARAVSALI